MLATARDMRYKTHILFDSLSRGDSVIITYRGRKTAVLAPYQDAGEKDSLRVRNHPFFGSVPVSDQSVDSVIDSLRGGRFDDI